MAHSAGLRTRSKDQISQISQVPIAKKSRDREKQALRKSIFSWTDPLSHLSSDSNLSRLFNISLLGEASLPSLDFLHSSPVAQIGVELGTCGISVPQSDSVANVIELLSTLKIHAIAVEDPEGRFVGILDLSDIALFFCKQMAGNPNSSGDHSLENGLRQRASSTPVIDIMDCNGVNAFHSIDESASAADLLRVMASLKAPRVVVTKDGKASAVLTESDVLKFLYNHKERLSEMKTRVSAISVEPMSPSELTTCDAVLPMFFNVWEKELDGQMISHGATYTDKLLGWLSRLYSNDVPYEPFVVKQTDTLEAVIKNAQSLRQQRIHIIDKKRQIIGELPVQSIFQHFICCSRRSSPRLSAKLSQSPLRG